MELVTSNWQHPTTTSLGVPKKTRQPPKSIHLVGLGPSHRDFLQMWLNPETPDVLYKRDETWTVNRGIFGVPNHDLLFVMDHIQGEADNFPVYGARLWHHDKPIITSDNADGWPSHVHRFPFDDIWTWTQTARRPPQSQWVVNSIAYVLIYAAWIGVEEIFTWGLDYHHHKSGRVEDGHPNVAYWVRFIEEVGVRVHAPHTSTFLDTNNRAFFYGYQNDPRPGSQARRTQFRRLVGLDQQPEESNG